MIIFLYGPDTFRSRRQLKKMIAKFKVDRDPQGLNVSRVDGEKAKEGVVLEQMLASPFLAERRMVVVENFLLSKDQDTQKEVLKRIEEKTLPESSVVVFWEAGGKYRTKIAKELFARLCKEKYAQGFEEMKGAKILAWIATEIKERGGQIDKTAAQYLVQHVGGDMWQLSSLLDQLLAYKNGEIVEMKDVQLFLDERADDNIFNLVDSIVGKNSKQVYQMIQQQYKIGEDAQFIFAMIVRQFRILLQLRDLFDRGGVMQSNVIAEKLGLHPFVVKKSLPLVKRYSMDEMKAIYEQLLEFDVQTKTGQGDQKTMLDVFVGKVCAV